MNPPNVNLQPGQSGPEVKKLQDFLISQGLSIPSGATGYFGNETKAALTQWQQSKGVEAGNDFGYWGPKSIAKATGATQTNSSPLFNGNQQISNEEALRITKALGATPEQYAQVEQGINALGSNGRGNDPTINPATGKPWTQQEVDNTYVGPSSPTANNPKVKELMQGGSTYEEILAGIQSGDISGLRDANGQPFSAEDQQTALDQAMNDTKDFYAAQKEKDTADTESTLAQKQADYQNYLATSKISFEGDKSTLDQNAVNQGVLFSGGRVQKEQSLSNAYNQNLSYKQGTAGRSIGDTARDYQYKYGRNAANSLSNYYSLGGNTYNPNVATGGVGSSSLSSIYNPSQYNFGAGTVEGEKLKLAKENASRRLWNKGNKLVASGYNNQIN